MACAGEIRWQAIKFPWNIDRDVITVRHYGNKKRNEQVLSSITLPGENPFLCLDIISIFGNSQLKTLLCIKKVDTRIIT